MITSINEPACDRFSRAVRVGECWRSEDAGIAGRNRFRAANVAFEIRPTMVFSFVDNRDFFSRILANISDDEAARLLIKSESPWVSEADGKEFRAHVDRSIWRGEKWIIRGDRIVSFVQFI